MTILIGHRFQRFTEPGSMGVVENTTFIRCFWPVPDEPVALFAPGSRNIRFMGPPTLRNVIWDMDTNGDAIPGAELLQRTPDAEYKAELAVKRMSGPFRRLLNLTDAEAEAWLNEHVAVSRTLPKTAAKHATRDGYLLRKRVVDPITVDAREREYVAEITKAEARDLTFGRTTRATLEAAKTFKDDEGRMLVLVEGRS